MTEGAPIGSVTALSVTAVKGTRLRTVEAIELGRLGARGDRRFFFVDERSRMVNGKQLGELQALVAAFDEDAGSLALHFPDGRVVQAVVREGEPLQASFYSAPREVRLVPGPWSEAVSEFVGRPVRLVSVPWAVDRGLQGAASLISQASLARLADEAQVETIDARRFRMLVEIDGVAAHAEDAWVGRRVRVGGALIRFHGHVGRCMITSRDPDTGVVDLPTLDLLGRYRRDLETTQPLAFGVYGSVEANGRVALRDPVRLVV